ncbi:MAG TPA: DsbA family protein [Baekduia sp.]|jgi:2-hydroxychromene-2-carboxylate isomerase
MPTLFYDLGSPYAYLAVERAEAVLGVAPRLHPMVLGPIFALRGHGSWAHTPTRAANQREIEERAARYGLPPIRWPAEWPPNTLRPMRAVVWAERTGGRGEAFARAAFRAAFAEGADLLDLAVLTGIASCIGLPAADLAAGIEDPPIKDALRASTQEAIDLGVRGAPTILTDDGTLVFGDDRLAEAARPR